MDLNHYTNEGATALVTQLFESILSPGPYTIHPLCQSLPRERLSALPSMERRIPTPSHFSLCTEVRAASFLHPERCRKKQNNEAGLIPCSFCLFLTLGKWDSCVEAKATRSEIAACGKTLFSIFWSLQCPADSEFALRDAQGLRCICQITAEQGMSSGHGFPESDKEVLQRITCTHSSVTRRTHVEEG